ncbi:MGH1-like glycoside hydrolase domain-containing protein [Agromyces bauzanensis]
MRPRTTRRDILLPALLLSALLAPLGSAASASGASAAASDAPPLTPSVGAGTSFLDHEPALAGMPDPDWFESNIPFVDLPDQEIESTYYYRWRLFKEALKYTGPDDGWIVTEFLGPVGYAAPGGAISAAAGHHIYEGRWLRDQRYLDDYIDYWLTGSGSGEKPATDGLNENTTDWAHQYSFWVADAVLARAELDGDLEEAKALLPALERQWQRWAPQFDEELGLYWQAPVWDAMEFTASSYQSDDPYHGGEGYRPTLNAYQYGDAMAISELARLTGDAATADRYAAAAEGLRAAQEAVLWDDDGQFYKHVMRDDNPDHAKLADREEIGFIPWYFHMAPADHDAAWAQLLDPQGFKAPYGPTTVERRSPWFMHEAENGCCRWDGPSWPYATSQTLTALGNLLADYPDQDYVDADDFAGLLHDYAMTQRKNGRPYTAEAHHPDEDRWLYDGFGHSEDYNHSTFNDLVLGSLIGIKGQEGDTVRIAPQVDQGWDHFAAENVPYHGHNLTVLWDRDGSRYGAGAGLSVFEDGVLIHNQATLDEVTLPIAPAVPFGLPDQLDDAANPSATGFPRASASYSNNGDPASEAIDGQDFQLDIPRTRWTDYRSPNASDWLQVDFGVPTPVGDVRTTFYDDGGGVRVPASYDVEYLTTDGDWASLPGQTRTPATLVGGTVNRILLDEPVITSAVRLVGRKQAGVDGFGVTAFGSWRSIDGNLAASIDTRADGSVAVTPGATTEVVTRVTIGTGGSSVAGDRLFAPSGWSVERLSDPIPAAAEPGTYTTTWRVTAPADLDASVDSPLRYVVDSTAAGLGASDRALASWVFDPAAFGHVVWDDDFSTDRLAEYTTSAGLGEPAPRLAVDTGAGTLEVSADARARGHLQLPVDATSSFALILEPKAFIDGSPDENSVFIGSAGSPEDFAMSWYNHSKRQSGVNVVVDGQGQGAAEGGGPRPVTWEPGQRLATVITDGQLTSWIETDGSWHRINAAPVSVAVPPATLADWFPSIDVRMDAGTISLDRITALRGGPEPVVGNTVPPTISGTPLVGEQLTADPGQWDADGLAFAFKWQSNGVAIPDATASTYVPLASDAGTSLSVVVTASKDGMTPGTGISAAVPVKFAATVSASHPAFGFSWQRLKVKVAVTSDGPVAGPVVVEVGSRSFEVVLDARGTGTVTLPTLSSGTYPVTARFAGSEMVAAASSPTGFLRIIR